MSLGLIRNVKCGKLEGILTPPFIGDVTLKQLYAFYFVLDFKVRSPYNIGDLTFYERNDFMNKDIIKALYEGEILPGSSSARFPRKRR